MSNITNVQFFKEQLRTLSLPSKLAKYQGQLPRSQTASFYRTIQKKPKILTKQLNICKEHNYKPLTSEQLKLLNKPIEKQSFTIQTLKKMISDHRSYSSNIKNDASDSTENCQLAKSALDIVRIEKEEKEQEDAKFIQKLQITQHRLSVRGPVKFKPTNFDWYDQSQMSKPIKGKYQSSSQYSQNKKSIRLSTENLQQNQKYYHPRNQIEGLSDKSQTVIFNEIILYDNNKEQMEVVQKFVNEQYSQKYPLFKSDTSSFIKSIHHQVKKQYMTDQLVWQPMSQMNKLTIAKDIKKIYGEGKYRWLKPGEECIIIQQMHNIIEQCFNRIELICQSIPKIINLTLTNSRLEYLTNYPVCMKQCKQIECHWKIIATRFRCSKKVDFNDRLNSRIIQTAQSRGHFLDLTKTDNLLVQYLWKHSSLHDKDFEQDL